ncbi:MAG TPA: uroporphyrinogen decarboxylase family protein, partial [Paludibacter sp.]|nr:uroporphyrinogen decarboxylase family protein [Paludibacter sp.]
MSNSIFTDTLKGIKRERPPVWFMRQAGRVLPSYLKMREKYSFREMMQNPELAAEVTLLPVNDLGVDAAILFSDILVIPEALGMNLEFTEKGPAFDSPLLNAANPHTELEADETRLEHIYKALDIVQKEKPQDVGLIGFCGAPFTTFCYMVEGNSANHNFSNAITLFY